jgi:hypothetical protein
MPVLLCIVTAALGLAGWFGYGIVHTLNHIPEAYAAWDTGTLLVEYMRSHDNRWPTSWDDLLTVLNTDSGRQILLRGARAGDLIYARSLRNYVSVNWSFDPMHPDSQPNPITRPDGSRFPVVWSGAEPNEMVREYLRTPAATRESDPRVMRN